MSKPPVSVRMYRGILGDCFLLTIGEPAAPREKRAHILIDCGVLQNVADEAKLMRDVAASVRSTVGSYLDLLVVTHEHWDHISGFSHARDLLIDGLEIRKLWLAWTERRGDEQADAYRAKGRIAKDVVARIAARKDGDTVTAGVERFNGPVVGGKLRAGDIIPALIERAGKTGSVEYLEPGQVLTTPGPIGLRANVLGPPRNPARLLKDLPSPGDARETYATGPFAASLAYRYALADGLDDALDIEGVGPFGAAYRRPRSYVEKSKKADAVWLKERYLAEANAWRSVDDDWIEAGGALALRVDSDTNNTSLTLAFELDQGGDVLLFAADAQVGNWLSWHDQSYPHPAAPGDKTATMKNLLARTVFYKVGHHASHNATLQGLGLELMSHKGLSAMIPVVEAEARRIKDGKAVHKGWDMPFPDLYTKLLATTGGRLLRGDADKGTEPGGHVICQDPEFLDRVTSVALYHELCLR